MLERPSGGADVLVQIVFQGYFRYVLYDAACPVDGRRVDPFCARLENKRVEEAIYEFLGPSGCRGFLWICRHLIRKLQMGS